MNFRLMIHLSGFISSANLIAQDSVLKDSVVRDNNPDSVVSLYNPPIIDSLNVVSMDSSDLTAPLPDLADTSANDIVVIEWPSIIYPVITFTESAITLPWSWGSWSVPLEPVTSDYWVIETTPYRNSLNGGLFDTTPHGDSSEFVYCETEPKQVSAVPPAKTPDPAKPAPLPTQPWYDAILPTRVTVSRFSSLGS